MRKTTVAFVFTASLALSPASAEESGPQESGSEVPKPPPIPSIVVLEQANRVTGEGFDPNVNGLAFKLVTPRLGLFTAFYVDRRYASAYVGPAIAPAEWLIAGCGAGVETTREPVPWRAGCVAWLGSETLSLLVFAEIGASGPWGRAELNWNIVPWAGVGALGDLELGVGPRLEFRAPKVPFTIWYAPAYRLGEEAWNHLLGFRLVL